MGARVLVENAEGAGILRCRVNELQGKQSPMLRSETGDQARSTGNPTPKPVKFKVEFSTPTYSPVSPAIDARALFTETTLTLTMEKGAHSTFKNVRALQLLMGRLRWALTSQ